MARLKAGPRLACDISVIPVKTSRSPRELAGCRSEGFSIYREGASGAWFNTVGEEFVTAAGDFVISDSEFLFSEVWVEPSAGLQPPEARSHFGVCIDIWRLPKALLGPHLPALGGPFWKRLKSGGIAAVLAAYLEALRWELPAIAPSQLDAVADNLARLTAVAVGAAQSEHREAVRTAFLERAKLHITRHLADPRLGPASVASALGVSERKLHLAFEPTGTSFAEFVRRRRLAECKAALASPVSADRSVADIAFGWASRAWLLSIAPSSASTASHLKTRAKRQRPPVSDPPGRRRPFCGK